MLTIDGGQFEGGGQIVRMAVSLSALTGTPVRITRVRARRDTPGLAAQHVAAIRAVSSFCDPQTTGVSVGSSVLTFIPSSLRRSESIIDVGTAGSIPLVLQAWLPVALKKGGSITIRGGTEVRHSPTIDYLERVFLPPLRTHGARVKISIEQRGYYPQGGGVVRVTAEPSEPTPLHLRSEEAENGIISCSSNLPDHVTVRQAESARKRLSDILGIDPPQYLDRRSGLSTGSSCTAWRGMKGGIALGSRGLPAEEVGQKAADMLIDEVKAGGMVDRYLADQMLLYLARYHGSYTVSELSLHTRTMQWLLSQFGYRVQISEGDVVEVSS
ncbi:MAG: RNA 3'-terminal phosphate cyclase [Methanomicrobiales archaeon]|nr:RNA 3'-terminal phosphate cyclase [Methanomicrobiales archaeon]